MPFGSPPVGEIDIIIATGITEAPFTEWTFQGRQIRIETSDEIMAKRCCFRAGSFKTRDIFDLAAVLHADPTTLSRLKPRIGDQWDTLRDRIDRMAPTYPEIVAQDVNPTEHGRQFLTRASMNTVLGAIRSAEKSGPSPEGNRGRIQ